MYKDPPGSPKLLFPVQTIYQDRTSRYAGLAQTCLNCFHIPTRNQPETRLTIYRSRLQHLRGCPPQIDFAHLSTPRHRDRTINALLPKYKYIVRHFIPSQSLPDPVSQHLVRRSFLFKTGCHSDESPNHLAVFGVGDSNDRGDFYCWVGGQPLFNFEGIDILAACIRSSVRRLISVFSEIGAYLE
jgi:hypothetical protein